MGDPGGLNRYRPQQVGGDGDHVPTPKYTGSHSAQSSTQNGYQRNKMQNGGHEWNLQLGDKARSQQNMKSRSDNRNGYANANATEWNRLASWKLHPLYMPPVEEFYRPYMGRCCSCLPNSRGSFFFKGFESAGIRDALMAPTYAKSGGRMSWLFSDVLYTWRQKIDYQYPNLTKEILGSESITSAIKELSMKALGVGTLSPTDRSHQKTIKKIKHTVQKILKTMQATMWLPLIKFTGWFLLKVLRVFLQAILVHHGQLSSVQRAAKKKLPLIFLPTHRSHLDYILITFILWQYGIPHPYVASGDNLNLPIFGFVLRSLGGFFIRRKIDKTDGNPDIAYRAVLSEYIQRLLMSGQNLEFYIEGGRSRSGKSLPPKAGLLSIVVDTVLSGKIEDAYIVPVSISYENLLDGNFTKEQLGQPKKGESFWGTVCGLWRVMRTNFGMVRVDFCQPFSVKEFLTNQRPVPEQFDLSEWLGLTSNSLSEGINRTSSSLTINGFDVVVDLERRHILPLANHIICDAARAAPVMCTSLLCLALSTLYRQKVTVKELVKTFDWLRKEVTQRERDLGFTGTSEDAIMCALEVVQAHLVRLTNGQGQDICRSELGHIPLEDVYVHPQMELPHVLELVYYKNQAITVFQLESIIACSVCALNGTDMHSVLVSGDRTFLREATLSLATLLSNILQFDLFLAKPCENLASQLSNTFDRLSSLDVYHRPAEDEEDHLHVLLESEMDPEDGEDPNEKVNQREWLKRFVKNSHFNGLDLDMHNGPIGTTFELSRDNASSMALLDFYQMLLAPVIESYWYVTTRLAPLLSDNTMSESDFIHKVQDEMIQRIESGRSDFAEACAQDTLRNCVKSLGEMSVLEIFWEKGVKMIQLNPRFSDSDLLNKLVTVFSAFKVR